jgi:hypothetical protein
MEVEVPKRVFPCQSWICSIWLVVGGKLKRFPVVLLVKEIELSTKFCPKPQVTRGLKLPSTKRVDPQEAGLVSGVKIIMTLPQPVGVGVAVWVPVELLVGVPVGTKVPPVGVFVGVHVGVKVGVGVKVFVLVGVPVRLLGRVGVGSIDGVGSNAGVGSIPGVAVLVTVLVGVEVYHVPLGVFVIVEVGVGVEVRLGVGVPVAVVVSESPLVGVRVMWGVEV